MNRFVSNMYDEGTFHTIGVEFLNKDIDVDGHRYTLQIWDTAGQERFRALRTPFYRGADICLLCYAINDHDSFQTLSTWRDEFIKYADVRGDAFPFIVVGNKNDLPPAERKVSQEEVSSWCQSNQIASFIETSAKASHNVPEAFAMAVRKWLAAERTADRTDGAGRDLIDLTKRVNISNSNTGCCGGSSVTDSPQRGNNMNVDRNNQL